MVQLQTVKQILQRYATLLQNCRDRPILLTEVVRCTAVQDLSVRMTSCTTVEPQKANFQWW